MSFKSPSSRLSAYEVDRSASLHRSALARSKASVDCSPPSTYFLLLNRSKKDQLNEEWCQRVDHENQLLLKKMKEIHKKSRNSQNQTMPILAAAGTTGGGGGDDAPGPGLGADGNQSSEETSESVRSSDIDLGSAGSAVGPSAVRMQSSGPISNNVSVRGPRTSSAGSLTNTANVLPYTTGLAVPPISSGSSSSSSSAAAAAASSAAAPGVKSLNGFVRKQEALKITRENASLYQRISSQRPTYSRHEWSQHSTAHQHYLKNMKSKLQTQTQYQAYHQDAFGNGAAGGGGLSNGSLESDSTNSDFASSAWGGANGSKHHRASAGSLPGITRKGSSSNFNPSHHTNHSSSTSSLPRSIPYNASISQRFSHTNHGERKILQLTQEGRTIDGHFCIVTVDEQCPSSSSSPDDLSSLHALQFKIYDLETTIHDTIIVPFSIIENLHEFKPKTKITNGAGKRFNRLNSEEDADFESSTNSIYDERRNEGEAMLLPQNRELLVEKLMDRLVLRQDQFVFRTKGKSKKVIKKSNANTSSSSSSSFLSSSSSSFPSNSSFISGDSHPFLSRAELLSIKKQEEFILLQQKKLKMESFQNVYGKDGAEGGIGNGGGSRNGSIKKKKTKKKQQKKNAKKQKANITSEEEKEETEEEFEEDQEKVEESKRDAELEAAAVAVLSEAEEEVMKVKNGIKEIASDAVRAIDALVESSLSRHRSPTRGGKSHLSVSRSDSTSSSSRQSSASSSNKSSRRSSVADTEFEADEPGSKAGSKSPPKVGSRKGSKISSKASSKAGSKPLSPTAADRNLNAATNQTPIQTQKPKEEEKEQKEEEKSESNKTTENVDQEKDEKEEEKVEEQEYQEEEEEEEGEEEDILPPEFASDLDLTDEIHAKSCSTLCKDSISRISSHDSKFFSRHQTSRLILFTTAFDNYLREQITPPTSSTELLAVFGKIHTYSYTYR